MSLQLTHCFVSKKERNPGCSQGGILWAWTTGDICFRPTVFSVGSALSGRDDVTRLGFAGRRRRTFFCWRSQRVKQWEEALIPLENRDGETTDQWRADRWHKRAPLEENDLLLLLDRGQVLNNKPLGDVAVSVAAKLISDPFFGEKFHRHRRDGTAKSQTLWLPINDSSYFSACEIVWIVADESGRLKWQTNGSAKGVLSDAGRTPRYQRHTLRQHNKPERYLTCDEYFRPWSFISRTHSGEAKM